jgi:hypothetical protein
MRVDGPLQPAERPIRLRYPGTCVRCRTRLIAGTTAIYESSGRTVRCLACTPVDVPPGSRASADQEPSEVETGQAGAGARRVYERRRDRRQARIRAEHPHLGRLILALTSDPQTITAWATGAEGEEQLGERLDRLRSPTVRVLHDRRIPGTVGNIDHLVVCPRGVLVIDAKNCKGRPRLRVQGGIFRPRTEHLMVGNRDRARFVDGVLKQVRTVRSTLAAERYDGIPVQGMLCFVGPDWPLLGGSFTVGGVDVVPLRAVRARIRRSGDLTEHQIAAVHRRLAAYFPMA